MDLNEIHRSIGKLQAGQEAQSALELQRHDFERTEHKKLDTEIATIKATLATLAEKKDVAEVVNKVDDLRIWRAKRDAVMVFVSATLGTVGGWWFGAPHK